MGLEELEEGDLVFVNTREAAKRDGDFTYFDKEIKEFIFAGDLRGEGRGYRLHQKDKKIPDTNDDYPLFANVEHVISYSCKECKSRKLWHDNKEVYFCPWCDDEGKI